MGLRKATRRTNGTVEINLGTMINSGLYSFSFQPSPNRYNRCY